MYGEWVTLNFGEAFECKVYVPCTPTTPDDKKLQLAKVLLRAVMDSDRQKGLDADERRPEVPYEVTV